MAEDGDPGQLPPEIRKEIYSYLLVESNTIAIKRFLPAGTEHKYDTVALRSRKKRSSGILRVNKFVNKEAAQVMYGCNKFEFMDAEALHHFLEQIGDARRHLCHVGIYQDELLFRNSRNAMKRSIRMLAAMRGLRTVEVSHSILCRKRDIVATIVQIKKLVQLCKPLLSALNDHSIENSLSVSVLDVVQMPILQGACKPLSMCSTRFEHPRMILVTDCTTRNYRRTKSKLQCGCLCSKVEDENKKLKQELEEEIARQLKLELP